MRNPFKHLSALLLAINCHGQTTIQEILSRGPSSQIVRQITVTTNESGETLSVTNSVVELGNGLNYWNGLDWAGSREEFHIVNGAAVADQGQHTAVLQPNLNSYEAVYMKTKDGLEFRSNPLFIALRDLNTGDGIIIGLVQDTVGQLVAPNVVLYTNAFDGEGINAAVRCTYRLDGFEQDVVLYKAINHSNYGIDNSTTRIEMWTEFYNPPDPTKLAASSVEGSSDVLLEFGSTQFSAGRAFSVHQGTNAVVVGKYYGQIDGRFFLVEAVDFSRVEAMMSQLPQSASVKSRSSTESLMAKHRSKVKGRAAMAGQIPSLATQWNPMIAGIGPGRMPSDPGLVIDYNTLQNPLTSSYVFQGDSTYLISKPISFSLLPGSAPPPVVVTFESGAVLKFANALGESTYDAYARITLGDGVKLDWKGREFAPIVLTATDDPSAGEPIAGAASFPPVNNYYASIALSLPADAGPISYARVMYANIGIEYRIPTSSPAIPTSPLMRHVQFIRCKYAVHTSQGITVRAQNILMVDCNNGFSGHNADPGTGVGGMAEAQHVTFDVSNVYGVVFNALDDYAPLINSLVIGNADASAAWPLNSSVVDASLRPGVFQSMFGVPDNGGHYLVNATYRARPPTGVNTPSDIDPDLAKDLARMTTYHPVVQSQAVSTLTTWALSSGVPRDNDGTFDLGYHYSAVDRVIGSLPLSAELKLLDGEVVAITGAKGFLLQAGGKLTGIGKPLSLNSIVAQGGVEEFYLRSADPTRVPTTAFIEFQTAAPGAASLKFTKVALPAGISGGNNLAQKSTSASGVNLELTDCQLFGTKFYCSTTAGGGSHRWVTTNSVFERCFLYTYHVNQSSSFDYQTRNALYKDCAYNLGINANSQNTWILKENMWVNGSLNWVYANGVSPSGSLPTFSNGYNVLAGSLSPLPWSSGGDTLLGNYSFASGPLGGLYQPVSYPGGITPDQARLAHYTVKSDGTKDSGAVNIGFHYVSLNSDGSLADTDQDGIPDLVEDSNSNRVKDGTEVSSYDSADTDGDGIRDNVEVAWGSNPSIADGVVFLNPATTISYSLASGPMLLWPSSPATHVTGSAVFVNHSGVLVVECVDRGDSDGKLGVKNVGTGATQIGVTSIANSSPPQWDIKYGGVSFATMSRVAGGLSFSLGAGANDTILSALLQNVTYENWFRKAVDTQRDLQVYLTATDSTLGAVQGTATKSSVLVQCATSVNVVLVLDKSGSMEDAAQLLDGKTRLTWAREAALGFLESLTPGTDKVGVVRFGTTAEVEHDIQVAGSDIAAAKAAIQTFYADGAGGGSTATDLGLSAARTGLTGLSASGQKVILLLTDGEPNSSVTMLSEAATARNAGIRLMSVGVVTTTTADGLLRDGVCSIPEDYYKVITGADVRASFRSMQSSLCRSPELPPVITSLTAAPSPLTLPATGQGNAILTGVLNDPDSNFADLRAEWTMVSGPGTTRFDNTTSTASGTHGATFTARAWFALPGTYRLQLNVSDGRAIAQTYVDFAVKIANKPPVVGVLQNQTVEVGQRVYLPGVVTDDRINTTTGLPGGAAPIVGWTSTLPGNVTFEDASQAETYAIFSSAAVYTLTLSASDGAAGSPVTRTCTITVLTPDPIRKYRNVSYASAGVGGMRNFGDGIITLAGVNGRVRKAFLYWHGPTDSEDPAVNQQLSLNGRFVTGRQLGFSSDNAWMYGLGTYGHGFRNSQAYVADVTSIVRTFGSGDYHLEKLTKGFEIDVNGASLMVFFDGAAGTARIDAMHWEGNDSNLSFANGADDDVYTLMPLTVAGETKMLLGGNFQNIAAQRHVRIALMKQDGTLDTGFDPNGVTQGQTGPDKAIRSILALPDGHIFIAGDFVTVNGQPRKKLARLNANGTLDTTWQAVDIDGDILCMAFEPVASGNPSKIIWVDDSQASVHSLELCAHGLPG